MFRLIFLVTSVVGFLRDYLFIYDEIFTVILYIFIVDSVAEIITKVFTTRSLNTKYGSNFLFHKHTCINLQFKLFIISSVIAAGIYFVFSEEKYAPILLCLPFAVLYKFLLPSILAAQYFRSYYVMELVKNLIIFTCFYSQQPDYFLIAYALVYMTVLTLWYSIYNKVSSQGLHLRMIGYYFRKDFWIIIQSAFVLGSYSIDKLILSDGNESPLYYLLATKFILFATTAFNSMFLIIGHVDLVNNPVENPLRKLFVTNLKWLVLIVVGYFLFFGVIIKFLPIYQKLEITNLSFYLVAAWLTLMLVREVLIRIMILKANISLQGKYMTGFGITVFTAAVFIDYLGIELMLSIYVLLNLIIISLFYHACKKYS